MATEVQCNVIGRSALSIIVEALVDDPMRPCKTVFAATTEMMLCLCAASCAPSTEERPQHGHSWNHSDTLPGVDDRRLAELRDLKADVTIERNRLGKLVVSIDLNLVRDVTPALRLVANLPTVDRVSLLDAELHSEDFELLRQMNTLRWLDLSNTTVTDADLSFLESTPQLEFLLLWSTGITDAGLQHVARLTRLQKLDLSGTKITGAGLGRLIELRDLLELYLEVPGIGEAELKRLQEKLPHTLIVH
jgi:hypothetical protein